MAMRMDPRCKRLHELSAKSQQLFRQLVERFLTEECEERIFEEPFAFGDYAFLACVGEKAEANMSEIARILGINPSTATRQVNRLLANRLMTKSVAPNDDRRYDLRLTPYGRMLLDNMEDRIYKAVQEAYRDVSDDELDVVYGYLEKYNRNLSRLLDDQ